MSKEIKAIIEKKGDTLIAVASTEDKDRMGDVIKASGWNLINFLKNPVIQFAHRYDEPPIGIAKNIKVEDNKLIFEPEFHEITQLSREIKAMYFNEPPIMRAFSVGFIPTKFNSENSHIIEEQELLEISAVPVPANQEALLVAAKSYSPVEEKGVMQWINKIAEVKDIKKEEQKKEEKVEKSPACRMDNESKEDCVSRKIPEILSENNDMEQDQAVAIANSVCDKPCGEKNTKEEIKDEEKNKELIKEIDIKEGRVLSDKNKKIVEDVLSSMKLATSALKDLLNASHQSTEKSGESESPKGRREVARKQLKNRVTVRALQKVDKEINNILRDFKSNG